MSAWVYRHYDDGGVLLYVGATTNIEQRTRGHITGSAWAKRINKIATEEFGSIVLARQAEAIAIATEQPLLNKQRTKPCPAADESGILGAVRRALFPMSRMDMMRIATSEVSFDFIYRLRSGKSKAPGFSKVQKLADALGVK